jgi:hypothetical protein
MALARVVAALLLAATLQSPSANAQDLNLDEPPKPPYKLGVVQSIKITRPIAENAEGDASKCVDMRRLQARDVRYFLKHSKRINRRGYLHDYFLTDDCYTEAHVTFKDGRTVSLGVANDAGTAVLSPIVKGKQQEQSYYRLCERCAGMLDLPNRVPPN